MSEKKQEIIYNKGDFIGHRYEVYKVLGKGGFGIVYLVYERGAKEAFALKTLQEQYVENYHIRKRFQTEAQIWVNLEHHPHLVRAYWIDEIAGRLYIAMEYIAPNEFGLNSLEGYLERHPPDLAQSLCWAIQFCYGMEYAYSKGVICHRDIKPSNIMISQDKNVRIADFGLASLMGKQDNISGEGISTKASPPNLTIQGIGLGTLAYMPPEQFTNAAGCDEKSDIYAFGIVLFQMAAAGRLPFTPSRDCSWKTWYTLHNQYNVPGLNSPLFPMIKRCLEKEPAKRYQSFGELRHDLEIILERETGKIMKPPKYSCLEAWELGNKGASLNSLGRFYEAIDCFDKALAIDPMDAKTWNNKGSTLNHLGRFDEAIRCLEKATNIDQSFAMAWNNKGVSYDGLGHFNEALQCLDRAIEIEPKNVAAWSNKGVSLSNLGRFNEALKCCDKALEIDPKCTTAWCSKGNRFDNLGRFDEAVSCYNKALEIDPRDVIAWYNKGRKFTLMGRLKEAVHCYDRALESDAKYLKAWNNKGICLDRLHQFSQAILCFDKALEFDPSDVAIWVNKGISLSNLDQLESAIHCYNKALEISPIHAPAWYSKALAEQKLGRKQNAVDSYRQFLSLAHASDLPMVEYVRKQLEKLEGK